MIAQQTPISDQIFTVQEYLTYDDGTDVIYELVKGQLVAMPPESTLNARIAVYIFIQFLQLVPFTRLCHKDTELQITSVKASFRIPDLMVLTEAGAATLTGSPRHSITLEMPPPLLVVEVVSPDDPARDYRHKRSEYAVRGIPEYWIVDSLRQQVLILTLVEGFYDETTFTKEQLLLSPSFPEIALTPQDLFSGF